MNPPSIQQSSDRYLSEISFPVTLYEVTSHQHRAVVSVSIFAGKKVVAKRFKDGNERFWARERHARRELSQWFSWIPPLLQDGTMVVVSPFYTDCLRYDRRGLRLFPLGMARQVVDVLEALYDAGYALLDAHPENLLVCREQGLKLVDFEFLHAYGADKPPCFLQSWDIVGPPATFSGDQPRGGGTSWERHWQHYVGLSIAELRSDSTLVQHVKRARHWLVRFLPRQLDHYLPPPALEAKARLASAVRSLLSWVSRTF